MALWRSILGGEKSTNSVPAPQMQRRERRDVLEKLVQETLAVEGANLRLVKPRLLSLDREGKEFMVLLELPRSPKEDQTQATSLQKIQLRLMTEQQRSPDLGMRSVYWTYTHDADAKTAGASATMAKPALAAAALSTAEMPTELAPLDDYDLSSNFPLLGSDFDRPSRPSSLL